MQAQTLDGLQVLVRQVVFVLVFFISEGVIGDPNAKTCLSDKDCDNNLVCALTDKDYGLWDFMVTANIEPINLFILSFPFYLMLLESFLIHPILTGILEFLETLLNLDPEHLLLVSYP